MSIRFKYLIVQSSFKSIKGVARHLQIPYESVSAFIHKRYNKISKKNRKLIRNFFIQQGFLPIPKRNPPKCRNCGTPYPTRKKVPVRATVVSGSAASISADRLGNPIDLQTNHLLNSGQSEPNENIITPS